MGWKDDLRQGLNEDEQRLLRIWDSYYAAHRLAVAITCFAFGALIGGGLMYWVH